MPQSLNLITQLQIIWDNISITQIRITQIKKTKITKSIPNNTNCILSSGSTKDVLEGMSAFFSNDEPPDKVMQVHVSSVDIIKDFKYYDIRISDTYRSNNKNQHQNT